MKSYDIVGIGNALLDIIIRVEDSVLFEFGLLKGAGKSISKEESEIILNRLKDYKTEINPGGSSANTLSGISFLGGNSVFFGKIGKDYNGKFYESSMKDQGVIPFLNIHEEEVTGHAITLITPDKERTFAAHLGASLYFRKEDISEEIISSSKILHLEGYQFSNPNTKEAVLHAVNVAKTNNTLVSIDLSDLNIIKKNLQFLRDFVNNHVNILFVNEHEAEAFTGKKEENALDELSNFCDLVIIKLGERGSLIKENGNFHKIEPFKTKVINTNGAGDMYAACILFGLTNHLDIKTSGELASYASSLVVANSSARLDNNLKKLTLNFVNDRIKKNMNTDEI